jgi:ABC-type sulfate/molybdate transport systems ATPase subunit
VLEIKINKRLGNLNIDVAFSSDTVGVTAPYGLSGAGKTSLINMVAGLLPPDQGLIAVEKRKLLNSSQSMDLPPDKRRCGYIFQDGRLFPHLTMFTELVSAQLWPEKISQRTGNCHGSEAIYLKKLEIASSPDPVRDPRNDSLPHAAEWMPELVEISWQPL